MSVGRRILELLVCLVEPIMGMRVGKEKGMRVGK
jgi:hypothetical protein